ncbi:MAG TPA: 50S ribosomal protein L29 [Candidatus Dormibacteraeota bacterium]|nr:50S ribosomal protein L29 [Candidatus Dormibacteraeota bacterium]
MKADELRTLDADELSSRLRGARRELYELRFKLAVGQLDDHRQIRKVRKDIARILTVVHARRLGEEFEVAPEAEDQAAATTAAATAVATEETPAPVEEAAAQAEDVETPENVEAQDERPSAPTGRSTRRRRRADGAGEDGND